MTFNPFRSVVFEKVNDPGGGGALKAPPYDLENYSINRHHIHHVHFTRCLTHVLVGFLTILQRFKNKSSEIRCKNDIFVILSKMEYKYTKRRRIFHTNLMQLVSCRYDY